MNDNQFMGLRIRFEGGGGCLNDKQFMGLQIRFEGAGYTNSARQSIRGAPDSMVEEA